LTGYEAAQPVVLYDGGCPLCRREIDHYRRIRGADQITWVDISKTPNLQWMYGVERDTAMRRFHVRTSDGRWQIGAYGFAEVWSHLHGYRLLATAVRGLRLLRPLDWLYRRFADWRFERRRCNEGACGIGISKRTVTMKAEGSE
jgi:predicted DCC family thiol-disulfide oxidoreductase YuxK